MWMMGYNEGCELNMWDNSFASRKLRPLVPRPMTTNSSNNNNVSTASSPPCLGRLHASDFFSLNHPLATMTDQNKRESSNTQPHVMVSSRWNPTPEQLRTLEELYRRGTRTPSADQIQHITAQLRRYGKIEGKNVFYWFQNHKARERQKRRRQIMEAAPPSDHHQNDQDHPTHDVEIFDKTNSGTNRTGFEGEHVKNWPPSTNGSTIPTESESMSNGGGGGAAKAGVVTDQCRPNGWSQLVEEELQQQQQQQEQQRRSYIMERNATWQQMMNLSCPSPTNLLINTTADSTITTTMTATTPTLLPSEATTIRSSSSMDHKLLKSHDLNYIFIAPHARHNGNGLNGEAHGRDHPDHGHECEDGQTLQLFPLHESDCKDYSEASVTNFNAPNYQFFEFLPLKN